MSNKELTKDESLALITDMIGQAKRNVARGGSFYFLLWGWVVLIANLGHYLIAKFAWYEHPYIVWILTIPAAIVSMVHGARRSKTAQVKSHLDRVYSQIWLAVFIGVLIILFFMDNVNYNVNAIILTFAGIGTFISGQALRFNPLSMGGIALWIASIVAFNLNPIDQYIVGAIGILAGYLIPGYLLRKAEK
ncbi:hypothetical protein [Ekhidna sp.]|uniref:hypothetical protein n=1 Tax=Ekhidna sp. TaxID=2608089 RepID=UPI003B50AB98